MGLSDTVEAAEAAEAIRARKEATKNNKEPETLDASILDMIAKARETLSNLKTAGQPKAIRDNVLNQLSLIHKKLEHFMANKAPSKATTDTSFQQTLQQQADEIAEAAIAKIHAALTHSQPKKPGLNLSQHHPSPFNQSSTARNSNRKGEPRK
jgi:hypothetical protein